MKQKNLTIEIDTKLTVSDESAERCLRLLEIWQEDHPDKYIEGREVLTDRGRLIMYRICTRENDGIHETVIKKEET